MQSVAVGAAQAAEAACRRLIQYQPVIDAARACVAGGSLPNLIKAVATLNESNS